MLASSAKVLIRIPVIIDAHRSQLKDSLGTQSRPSHTGLFHAVLDQMTARAFDDTRADGPTSSKVAVITHVGQVASIVADGCVQDLALGRRGGRVLGQAFQGLDDSSRLARQDAEQLFLHPGRTVGAGLTQERIGRIPEILGYMDDVQDQLEI